MHQKEDFSFIITTTLKCVKLFAVHCTVLEQIIKRICKLPACHPLIYWLLPSFHSCKSWALSTLWGHPWDEIYSLFKRVQESTPDYYNRQQRLPVFNMLWTSWHPQLKAWQHSIEVLIASLHQASMITVRPHPHYSNIVPPKNSLSRLLQAVN